MPWVKTTVLYLLPEKGYVDTLLRFDGFFVRQRKLWRFFAAPPYCPHGLNGIVVSDQARIGKMVTILQQVTIGVKSAEVKGAPFVGDCVTIGAGAKLIGPIHIGNGVTIGANAVVTKDIPDGATVIGNPGRVIKIANKGATEL